MHPYNPWHWLIWSALERTRKPDPIVFLPHQAWAQICHLIEIHAAVVLLDCTLTCKFCKGHDRYKPWHYLISSASAKVKKTWLNCFLHHQAWAQIYHRIENRAAGCVLQNCTLTCTLCNGYDPFKPWHYLISSALIRTRKLDPIVFLPHQAWAQICHLIDNPAAVVLLGSTLTCTLCNGYDPYKPWHYLISSALERTRKPDPIIFLHHQAWAHICHLIEIHAAVAVLDCTLTCTVVCNGCDPYKPWHYLISSALVWTRKPDPIVFCIIMPEFRFVISLRFSQWLQCRTAHWLEYYAMAVIHTNPGIISFHPHW